jgi:hypothetical protein
VSEWLSVLTAGNPAAAYQRGPGVMDNPGDFYPPDAGSIPAGRATIQEKMMDDLEMLKRCGEAMGWKVTADKNKTNHWRVYEEGNEFPIMGIGDDWLLNKYNPLAKDDQAMALVKKFDLSVSKHYGRIPFMWEVEYGHDCLGEDPDLNRAIVECVAKMQVESTAPEAVTTGTAT